MKIGSVAEANAARRDLERIVQAWCEWRDSLVGGKAVAARKAVTSAKKKAPVARVSARATGAARSSAGRTAATRAKKSAGR
jgi:hypothetical protein